MREIKFRTFYKDENILYRDVDISSECLPIDDENVVIMQYTGLKDKNGVEIYEGDILAGCNGSINGFGKRWGNYSIYFKDGKFNVPLWGTLEHQDSTHWVEVIGNIYENPELLHVKDEG